MVDIEFFDDTDKLDGLLRELVGAMEHGRPRAWSPDEMGERYRNLSRHVIGFNARIRARRARFKLGQDERDDVYADITAALAKGDERELLDWMIRCNSGRPGA